MRVPFTLLFCIGLVSVSIAQPPPGVLLADDPLGLDNFGNISPFESVAIYVILNGLEQDVEAIDFNLELPPGFVVMQGGSPWSPRDAEGGVVNLSNALDCVDTDSQRVVYKFELMYLQANGVSDVAICLTAGRSAHPFAYLPCGEPDWRCTDRIGTAPGTYPAGCIVLNPFFIPIGGTQWFSAECESGIEVSTVPVSWGVVRGRF